MVPTMNLMDCPNLAMPAEVMRHIVQVESGGNPLAIGIVGARLVRQPRNVDEAVATAHMLDAKGYNYSLGVAQINRANLARFGLKSYEKAFDPCANLAAGSRILAQCLARSGGDWGPSFSCYYSGNFVTGYRDGYVRKIQESIDSAAAQLAPVIIVRPAAPPHSIGDGTPGVRITTSHPDLRTAGSSMAHPAARDLDGIGVGVGDDDASRATVAPRQPAVGPNTSTTGAFVPRVTGPPGAQAPPPSPPEGAAAVFPPPTDPDLRPEESDAAFVF